MRVLLISPPIEDFFFTPVRAYPLGLLYIATVLQHAGLDVSILNAVAAHTKHTIPIPSAFEYLTRYYKPNKSAFCLFSHYYHFGLTYEEIEEGVRKFRPDIVGISSNFSPYFDSAAKVAVMVKRVDTRIPVVLGGRFPTIEPDFVLRQPYIDFVLRGESEFSLLALCRAIEQGTQVKMQGLCFTHQGKARISKHIARIEDLDALPIPDRTLIEYRSYRFDKHISTSLISSRGCPQACSFCAISEQFRTRDPEHVIEEIKSCLDLGITHFNFEDDNINLNPHFEKVLDFIIANRDSQISLSFMNGLMSSLPGKMRKKLDHAGLTHLDLSLVSSSAGLRTGLDRKEKPRTLFAFSDTLLKNSIITTVHFIIGFPFQKFNDAIKDLKYLAKRRVKLGPSIFYPVIEGKVFKILSERFAISTDDRAFFRSSCAYFDKGICRDDIFLLLYLARMINFTKQLIDDTGYCANRFNSYLESEAAKLACVGNRCVSGEVIPRDKLGILILHKMIKEHSIYRVEMIRRGGQFEYRLYEEEFVDSKKLTKSLQGLSIRGIKSDVLIKI